MDMKDRIAEILGLTIKPPDENRKASNGWSAKVPTPPSISEIQITSPTFGPETESSLEQGRGIIQEDALGAFRRANAYFAVKNYGRAVSDYTRAAALSPRMPEIFFNRAMANEKAGRATKAIEDYTSAIEADRQYLKAYCNRAALLWSQGETGWALEDMKQAARLGLKPMQTYLKSKGIDW
jgi:tetratricopeptide (TPR) repeat protein